MIQKMTAARRWRLHIAMLLIALTAGCRHAGDLPAAATQSDAVVVHKSANDAREYRYLELANRMRVLLVSDPGTDRAAASLVVFRGSYHEPAAYPGLAHFLEHMLFIGTERYPEVDGYQQFLGTHGGQSNAYTASDHTNYFFDIQPAYLGEALDRFAQFFLSPLLAADYVEREKQAVNSEYQMQFKADSWRGAAAQRMVINPDHPASRFTIGSLDTLGPGVQDALVEFFRTEYSADQMALVVLGAESLDELARLVTPLFGRIPDRDIGPDTLDTPMFAPGTLPTTLRVVPLKVIREVSYDFPVPSMTPFYREQPDLYVTNLLGHEGEGSLYEWLKEAGWIESLHASSSRFDDRNAFITVSIGLTESGAAHIDDVTTALFAFIDLLKRTPPAEWRYAEQAKVAELAFRYQEQVSPLRFVYATAPDIAHYAPEDLLRAPFLMQHFDPDRIRWLLGYLTPDNLLVTETLPDAPTDRIEPYFQVPYAVVPGPAQLDGTRPGTLALPAPNPFLPESLELVGDDPAVPRRAVATGESEVWLDTDTFFGTPRANLFLNLAVPEGLASREDQVAATIYARIVADELNAYAYPAYLAGLSFGVSTSPQGFLIRTSGYTDKQTELLAAVLDAFENVSLDAERFARYQQELVRNWRNFANERPYAQAWARLGEVIMYPRWSHADLADALAAMSIADLNAWRERRFGPFGMRALLHGNVTETDVAEFTGTVRAHLDLGEITALEPAVRQIDGSYRVPLEVDHDDASMVLFVQDADASFRAQSRSALAAHVLKQPYFTELRTEQQLGYVVSATHTAFRDQAGVGFIVQSPVASARAIEAATLAFLDEQIRVVDAMPAEVFLANKAGLIAELTEEDQNLAQRSDRLWHDLELGVTTFDSNRRIAAEVERLEPEDLRAVVRELAARAREARVIIYSPGRFEEAPENGELLRTVSLPLRSVSTHQGRTPGAGARLVTDDPG